MWGLCKESGGGLQILRILLNLYKIVHQHADQLLLLRSLQPRYQLVERQVAAVHRGTEQDRFRGKQADAREGEPGQKQQQEDGEVNGGAVSLPPSSLYLEFS